MANGAAVLVPVFVRVIVIVSVMLMIAVRVLAPGFALMIVIVSVLDRVVVMIVRNIISIIK